MGVEFSTARFLIALSKSGVPFGRTLTLGRQWMVPDFETLKRLFEEQGLGGKHSDDDLHKASGKYADDFFRLLGATELVSMDASSYEGASIVHDMNQPVDDSLKESFDLVFDGGTLEHVFNYPTAIRSAMEMVKVGGRFVTVAPSNNYFGHGFYQLSPELFYTVLSEENGYKVERMIAYESFIHRWFEVADPRVVKRRVELVNGLPVLLITQARRLRVTPIFQKFPQQTDYVAAWQSEGTGPERRSWTRSLKRALPRGVLHGLRGAARTAKSVVRGVKPSFGDRTLYKPIGPSDIKTPS